MKKISSKHKKKVGLAIGKFAPLHKGHQNMIETALNNTDTAYIMVYDRNDMTDIPVEVRAGWIKTLYPKAKVLTVPAGPPDSHGDPELMKQHEDFIKKHLPEKATHFFTSDWYGDYISKALGAKLVVVDEGRKIYNISGTMIRQNPKAHKDFMHPMVYKDVLKYYKKN